MGIDFDDIDGILVKDMDAEDRFFAEDVGIEYELSDQHIEDIIFLDFKNYVESKCKFVKSVPHDDRMSIAKFYHLDDCKELIVIFENDKVLYVATGKYWILARLIEEFNDACKRV